MQSSHLASAEQHLQHASAAEKAGRLQEALEHATRACACETLSVAVLSEAARIAKLAGAPDRAVSWYQRALGLQSSQTLKFSYCVALMDAGDLATAESELRAALVKSPQEFRLLNLLGVVLKRARRYPEALEWFMKAAKSAPKFPAPWSNMGNCYLQSDAPSKAAQCFERATQLAKHDPENYRLLGQALVGANQADKALKAFKAALLHGSKNPWTYIGIAHVYCIQEQCERGLQILDDALALFPDNLNLLRHRANTLKRIGRLEEARAGLEKIIQHYPDDVETLVTLGNLYLWNFNQRQQANQIFERVLALNPDHIDAASSYCESLSNSRYGDESVHFQKAYQVACTLLEKVANPLRVAGALQGIFLRAADYQRIARLGSNAQLVQYWVEHNNVNYLHNQLGRVESDADRIHLLKGHRTWGDRIQALAAQQPLVREPGWQASKARARREKIRIAFMSSDLRHHPVTYFVQPILEHYDRSRFELYCYSFFPSAPDAVQQRIASMVDRFEVIRHAADRDIAQTIANHGVDILFELGGTTLFNRVKVCAWRPAPIQVSWLGYPHSVGLSHIDYILVDPYNQPAAAELLIEKPLLMPETWVSLGSLGFQEIPIEPGLPQDRQHCITFGTANNPYKYTRASFAAWARVMNHVPGSKFLFVRPEGGARAFRDNVLRLFAEHGIAPERIVFEAVRGAHLPHFNRIDIALDPFPHVGGTSTCESLWMGVPVVTLVGPAFFERLSASNLHNAGLGDLCAPELDQYVRIASQLAADRDRRLQLRHGMRAQIRAHPLGQSERFARHFEVTVQQTLEKHR